MSCSFSFPGRWAALPANKYPCNANGFVVPYTSFSQSYDPNYKVKYALIYVR